MDVEDLVGDWDYTSLPANVRLGRDCFLERKGAFGRYRSVQDPGLVLGDRVQVHTWTNFSIEPTGSVEVGDDSVLVGALFMCAERITLGRGVVLSYNVAIADCDFHPKDPLLRKQDAMATAPEGDERDRPPFVTRPVVIEDGAWIGIGAFVLKGVVVGRGARIGPGAIVTSDVPPGAVVYGNPAAIAPPGLFP